MNMPTHMIGAAATAVTVAAATELGLVETGILVAGALVADRIPDQDRHLDNSYDHRSVTHSMLVAGGLVVLAALWTVGNFGFAGQNLQALADDPGPLVGVFSVGAATGYLTHLVLDSMTPKRVWLLLPGGPKFGLILVGRTGGLGEWVVFFGLAALFGAGLALQTGILSDELAGASFGWSTGLSFAGLNLVEVFETAGDRP